MQNQQHHQHKLTIVKIGGNIIDDNAELKLFLNQFSAITHPKILIHGGGKLATQMAGRLGIEQKMVEGRRITDMDTLEVVTMVYGGLINKNITATLQSLGCNAIGITGADGNSILAHKRIHATMDYGFAGDVDKVNTEFFQQLLQQKLTPVVAPLTHNGKGQLLNTNADTIAQELAKSLAENYSVQLVYGFEKAGVLHNVEDDNSVIPLLDKSNYADLKKQGSIFAGMIPKLDNAFTALDKGVQKIIIGPANKLADLLEGKCGTTIISHE